MIRGVETLGMCGEVGIAVRDADLREIDGQRQRGHNQQKIRSDSNRFMQGSSQ